MRIVLLTLLACDTEPDDSGGDTSAPVAPDCVVSDEAVQSVDVSVTAMPTVLQATWSLAEAPSARLRFVDSTGRWVENVPDDGLMVGLLPSSNVDWQLVWASDGETRCSSVATATTGALDAPSVPVEGALAPGYVVVPMIDGASTAIILDTNGKVVWALAVPSTIDTQMIRARLGRDRRSLLYHIRGIHPDTGAVVRVGLDGVELDRVALPGLEIDWDELEDGRIAGLDSEMRRYASGQVLRGDRIVVTDGENAEVLWTVLDALGPDETYEEVEPGEGLNFTEFAHANGLSYDGTGYLVSLGDLDGVVRVGVDGSTEWVLGADTADFSLGADDIVAPHSAMPVDGGVIVYNRGREGDGESICANATEFSLDTGAKTATVRSKVKSDPCLVTPFLGHAQRLATGETLVDHSSAGLLQQVDADGTVVFSAQLAPGGLFGFALHVGELATPIGN